MVSALAYIGMLLGFLDIVFALFRPVYVCVEVYLKMSKYDVGGEKMVQLAFQIIMKQLPGLLIMGIFGFAMIFAGAALKERRQWAPRFWLCVWVLSLVAVFWFDIRWLNDWRAIVPISIRVVVLIASLYVLGKHKSEFVPPPKRIP